MRERIVITGVGAVTPLGNDAPTLLRRWLAGDCGIVDGLGRCSMFDPSTQWSRKEIRRTDRFTQLAVWAADEALEQAGWTAGLPADATRIGCIAGTGFGGMETIEDQLRKLVDGGVQHVSALGITMSIPNAAPGMLALRYGLRGSAHSVVSACAAGGDAIGTAARLIDAGDLDAAIAFGADASLTPLSIAYTQRAGAMSKSGISRPFDARRDGLVLGEGAGVLLLEREDIARARGARPLGELLGYGSSTDAYHLAAPHPEGEGAARAIGLALADAGLAPEDIAYVNAHGTSTPMGDLAETRALKTALGDAVGKIPVSSTKSAIGHLCGAAGAVEAVVTLLALREAVAPPTLEYLHRDGELDLNYVPVPEPLAGNGRLAALSNSFGFGGHNAVLCLAVDGETIPD